jgi:uncharacterized coiled-coil protein SlyX
MVVAEKKELQENYLEAIHKVSQLETELDKANVNFRLLEDKLRAEQGTRMRSQILTVEILR